MSSASWPPCWRSSSGSELSLFARFLRFGLLAFGGPVAQIAMLRRELVEEERWIDGRRFNRLLAVYQALPGPEATELAVHLGLLRGGRVGALLAGLGFTLPGFALMLGLAWLYFQVDLTGAAIGAAILGVQVAVVALIVRASERIGRHVLVAPGLWVLAGAAAVATAAGVPFWIVLPIAGAAFVIAGRSGSVGLGAVVYAGILIAAVAALALAVAEGRIFGSVEAQGSGAAVTPGLGAEATLPAILLSGLKAGLLTFGGAYTAIPFIRDDAVGSGWLTDAQFLDGLALGGVLPAPLVIFGTFVGYVAGGPAGAVAMTLGIFIPAFAFSMILGDRIEAVVARPGLHRLLEGVAAGVVGIIVVTAFELGGVVVGRLPALAPGAAIFVVALVVLFRWQARAVVPAVLTAAGLAGWLSFFVLRG